MPALAVSSARSSSPNCRFDPVAALPALDAAIDGSDFLDLGGLNASELKIRRPDLSSEDPSPMPFGNGRLRRERQNDAPLLSSVQISSVQISSVQNGGWVG